MSLDPLPYSTVGSYIVLSGLVAAVIGVTKGFLTMFALVPMVYHVVLGGSAGPKDKCVGPPVCMDVVECGFPLGSLCVFVVAAACNPLPPRGSSFLVALMLVVVPVFPHLVRMLKEG